MQLCALPGGIGQLLSLRRLELSENKLVELPSSRVGGRSAVMVRGLPAGWEKKTDSTGRAFYVDNHNERTSWDPPVGYDGDVFVSK